MFIYLHNPQDRNYNDESKSSENIRGSDFGRNRWKGNQQLSGEGIQIVVDHVDRSEDQRRQSQNNRHGMIYATITNLGSILPLL